LGMVNFFLIYLLVLILIHFVPQPFPLSIVLICLHLNFPEPLDRCMWVALTNF
jgi:hypothetical protein